MDEIIKDIINMLEAWEIILQLRHQIKQQKNNGKIVEEDNRGA